MTLGIMKLNITTLPIPERYAEIRIFYCWADCGYGECYVGVLLLHEWRNDRKKVL